MNVQRTLVIQYQPTRVSTILEVLFVNAKPGTHEMTPLVAMVYLSFRYKRLHTELLSFVLILCVLAMMKCQSYFHVYACLDRYTNLLTLPTLGWGGGQNDPQPNKCLRNSEKIKK